MRPAHGSDGLGWRPVLSAFVSPWPVGIIRQFKASLAAGLFLVLPILLFVHRYIDDYGRSMDGEYRWAEVGRPLAAGLVALVNLGAPAVAVAPLHQLLAVGVLALVAVAAARAYGLRSPFWSALATLPLLGQPYALENLSYGFDCLAMALALGLAVVASVTLHRVVSWRGLLVSSALLLASLCLYQPATSGFLPFALMLVVGEALGLAAPVLAPPSLCRRLGRVWASYGLALASYLMLIRLVLQERTSYATEQGRALPLDAALPTQLLRHALEFWQIIFADWSRWPISVPWLLLLLAYAVVVWVAVGRWTMGRGGNSAGRWRQMACSVLVLAAVALIALVSPGALLGLVDPLARAPRLLLFFGPLLSAVALQIVAGTTQLRWRVVPRAALVALGWLLVVVAYAYGHATSAQGIYEQGRISRLIGGITRLQVRLPEARLTAIRFEGGMRQSPVLHNSQTKFPLLDRLVPRLINDDWSWGRKQLQFHGLKLERSQLEPGAFRAGPCVPSETTDCSAEYSLQVRDGTLLVRML
jgi:hypothetical protein